MSEANTTKSKDNEYVLRDVARNLLSDECHTSGTLPRVTQPSIGKYLVRLDAKSDYVNSKIEVHPNILEKWLYEHRHEWVPRPGENDYFIHKLTKNYSIDRIEYNPKKFFKPQIIPRPYNCELSSVINKRLHSPEAEEIYKEESYCQKSASVANKNQTEASPFDPPFWWKEEILNKDDINQNAIQEEPKEKLTAIRWKPIPNLIKNSKMTSSERREAMHTMGIPFKHEACTFYNKVYPAPKLTYVPQSFSK